MAMDGAAITRAKREVDRLKTVQAAVNGVLRVGMAAQRLGLSRRQLERLLQRYKAEGTGGLLSRKRERPSNHQLCAGLAGGSGHRADPPTLRRLRPILAAEKLRERHGVVLGKKTVRQRMIAAGLWRPRRQRTAPVHQPRSRRPCLGELVQIDGCEHAWFEDARHRARCWCSSTTPRAG